MCSYVEELPVEGVLIISTERPAESLILKILDVEVLPTPSVHNNGIKGYEWKVDTKYYSAVVNLFSVEQKTEFDDDFCSSIRATVFYFNGKEPSSFDHVLNWMPSLKHINSEVQLLVCDTCGDEVVCKKNILNWCIENQFELIELESAEESEEEDGDILSQSKGYGRVIEALQSHTWSNLVMKQNLRQQGDLTKEEVSAKSNSTPCSSDSQKVADSIKKMTVDDEELLLEEQWLQNVLQQDDPNGESFEALFSKFASMKEKASNLTGEDRKKYAEKVAIAFWKALGGEEEEIEGLDDE